MARRAGVIACKLFALNEMRSQASRFIFAMRFMAAFKDRSESRYSFHAVHFAINAGTVRTVKRVGSRPFFTWLHVSGIETGAPSRARGESGATAVDIRSLRK